MSDPVAERLRAARAATHCSQVEFAKKIDLSLSALKRIEAGYNVPSGETLLSYVKLGFSPTWILTGDGPMRLGDEPQAQPTSSKSSDSPTSSTPAGIDGPLYDAVRKLVVKIYSEEQVRLPQEALFQEVAHWYNEVWARADDRDERLALMSWLETRLRKQLKAGVDEPGTGKHRA